MKKLIVIAVVFLVGMTVQANQVTHLDHGNQRGIRSNHAQHISFVKQGIQFFITTDGQLDFENIDNGYRGRRGSINVSAPGAVDFGVHFPYSNRGFVRYDRWGNVTRIGNMQIFYNRRGQVKHIGNLTLRYNRGLLSSIDRMFIYYNRFGVIMGIEGNLRGYRNIGVYCTLNGCFDNHYQDLKRKSLKRKSFKKPKKFKRG